MSAILDLPDTPEGRAIHQLAGGLCESGDPRRQLRVTRSLARVAVEAMARIVGCEATGDFFVALGAEMHKRRGRRPSTFGSGGH